MRIYARFLRFLGAAGAFLIILASCSSPAAAQTVQPQDGGGASPRAVPNFDHIAIVVMENRGESTIMGNAAAPFINGLANQYAYSDDYYAVAHPSLPNYLALIGGDTYGVQSDCSLCFQPAPSLADSLAGAGISGIAYMEGMPSPCFVGSSGQYAQKHNPFIYFDGVRNNFGRCQAIVPYSQLATDAAASRLPQFMWITPNLCNDMHDCSVATGDAWLARNIGPLMSSPAFASSNWLLAIVWDEAEAGPNRVPLILAGPSVKRGYVSHQQASHYSLLKTVEAAWNLPTLTSNDSAAHPLTDFFTPSTP